MASSAAERAVSGKSSGGSTRRMLCGFRVVPERDSVACKAENICQHTLPMEALSYTPAEEVIVCKFKNGDQERKIYLNIELEKKEQEQLKALRKECQDRNLEFFPSIVAMASRFLSRSRGDAKKAVKLMEATQAWRADYFKNGPVEDNDEMVGDLGHGIVYFTGRDNQLRPTIVIRAIRIPQVWYKEKRIDRLIRILIFCMEYMLRYMLIPGRVENNCLIVDLAGLTVAQVPLGALGEVYNVMSHHYIGRVFKFYVCNLSTGLKMITGMAKSLLTDRQKQKLVFVDDLKELHKEFALHQLETDLGGTKPMVTSFLPFPLLPGPFDAGSSKGASSEAITGVHELLTPAGARGRIWDGDKTKEENIRLEYSAKAPDIFERCNVPLPPDVLAVQEQNKAKLERAASRASGEGRASSDGSGGGGGANGENGEAPADALAAADLEEVEGVGDGIDCGDEEVEILEDEAPVIFDDAVKPSGCFSCRPCLA